MRRKTQWLCAAMAGGVGLVAGGPAWATSGGFRHVGTWTRTLFPGTAFEVSHTVWHIQTISPSIWLKDLVSIDNPDGLDGDYLASISVTPDAGEFAALSENEQEAVFTRLLDGGGETTPSHPDFAVEVFENGSGLPEMLLTFSPNQFPITPGQDNVFDLGTPFAFDTVISKFNLVFTDSNEKTASAMELIPEVPEPASLGLVMMGCLMLAARRRA